MNIKPFIIKQIWRIKQTYTYLLPLIGIINTILYFVIAIGVTNLVQLTFFRVSCGILGIFLVFNLVGLLLDKTNVFSKDYEKMFEGMSMTSSGIIAEYQALKFVQYSRMTDDEIADLVDNHKVTQTMRRRAQ